MIPSITQRILAFLSATDIADKAARVYLESLVNRYCDLTIGPVQPGNDQGPQESIRLAEIEAKHRDPGGVITMSDALLYERLAVKRLPDARIPAIHASVRSHYQRFCSPTEFAAYLKLQPPSPTIDQKKDEIDCLIGRIQDSYVFSPLRERVRSQLSMRISLVLLVCTLVILLAPGLCALAVVVRPSTPIHLPWWLVYAAISGAVGGLVSVHYRIQSLTVAGDAIRGALALCNGWFSVYFAPVIGAVSAVLLALLFRSGLVSGALFPKLATGGPPFGPESLASLLVWSFIAGFIERLVPDTLTRLSDAVGGYRFPQQAEQDRSRVDTTALLADMRRLKPQDPTVHGSAQHVEPPAATPLVRTTETTPQAASQ